MGDGLNLVLQGLAVAVLLGWAVWRVWRLRPRAPAAISATDCGGCKGCEAAGGSRSRVP